MSTFTMQPTHPIPSALYPVVEDLTAHEYGCCPCDHSHNIFGRFPLKDIAFPLAQPLDMHQGQEQPKKHHRRSSSSSSSLLKRRSSRSLSMDDETSVSTEVEVLSSKYQDEYVLTRQVSIRYQRFHSKVEPISTLSLKFNRFLGVLSHRFGNAFTVPRASEDV